GEGGDAGEGGGEDELCEQACAGLVNDCLPDDSCPQGNAGAIEGSCVAACVNGSINADTLYNDDSCESAFGYVRGASDAIDTACGEIQVTASWGLGCEGNGGEMGVCGPVADCNNRGGYTEAGHCPGSSDVMCCLDLPCSDGDGICLDSDQYSCGVDWTSGLCPGGNSIKCCKE
ncbi:hypothetical protein KKB55_11385, partial [Myxococcota bacterium]|nr:hypothetical protein [Myxococcota bacterium]